MSDTPTPGLSTRWRVTGILLLIAAVVLVIDIVTKCLVVAHIDPARPVRIIGDTVTLTLLRNSGAAFSMATGYTWVLTVIAVVVVAVIIRFSSRLRSGWWMLGLGLVLGGALGNLVDRIFRAPGPLRGYVVDFISVGWWPVFNVADSAVVCGAVLLVVLTVIGIEFDGSRNGWAARGEQTDDAVAESAAPESAASQSSAPEAADDQPTEKGPEQPTEKPADRDDSAQAPADDTPADETPAGETPADESPETETPDTADEEARNA